MLYSLCNGQIISVPDERVRMPPKGSTLHRTKGFNQSLTVIDRHGEAIGFWEIPKGKKASDYPVSFAWHRAFHRQIPLAG